MCHDEPIPNFCLIFELVLYSSPIESRTIGSSIELVSKNTVPLISFFLGLKNQNIIEVHILTVTQG